jgi:hypothetical protein
MNLKAALSWSGLVCPGQAPVGLRVAFPPFRDIRSAPGISNSLRAGPQPISARTARVAPNGLPQVGVDGHGVDRGQAEADLRQRAGLAR